MPSFIFVQTETQIDRRTREKRNYIEEGAYLFKLELLIFYLNKSEQVAVYYLKKSLLI